jgi:hypothetical protein
MQATQTLVVTSQDLDTVPDQVQTKQLTRTCPFSFVFCLVLDVKSNMNQKKVIGSTAARLAVITLTLKTINGEEKDA